MKMSNTRNTSKNATTPLSSCYDDLDGTRHQGYSAIGLRAQGSRNSMAIKHQGLKIAKNELRMATWNVRTLLPPGKPELVCRALHRYSVDICCLQETRLPDSCELNVQVPGLDKSFKVFCSTSDGAGHQGVGIAIRSELVPFVSGVVVHSPRILSIQLDSNLIPTMIISDYAPTNAYSDQSKDAIFSSLTDVVQEVPRKDFLFVGGDFNGQTGTSRSGVRRYIGNFGIGRRCGNGTRLLDLAMVADLTICGTHFQHKVDNQTTWISPDGRTQLRIDHTLIRSRWRSSIKDTISFWDACKTAPSDHSLTVTTTKLRLRFKRPKVRSIPIATD